MNGEKLFEGMGHVGQRFIEEAEFGELPEVAPIFWRRGVAAAACLSAIMVGSILLFRPEKPGISGENTPAGSVYGLPENYPAGGMGNEPVFGFAENLPAGGIVGENILLGAAYFRTNALSQAGPFPQTEVLQTSNELEQYIEENREVFDLSSLELSGYTSGFFTEHDLILLVLEEESGSIRHQVQAVCPLNDGWRIALRRLVPEVCTNDMAQWHILLTVEKGSVAKDDSVVIEQWN